MPSMPNIINIPSNDEITIFAEVEKIYFRELEDHRAYMYKCYPIHQLSNGKRFVIKDDWLAETYNQLIKEIHYLTQNHMFLQGLHEDLKEANMQLKNELEELKNKYNPCRCKKINSRFQILELT